MSPPKKYVTEQPVTPAAPSTPVTPARPVAESVADPFSGPKRGYIIDSSGNASAGVTAAGRAPLVTNDPRLRVNAALRKSQESSNLPIESARSLALKAETDAALAKQAEQRHRHGPGRARSWLKLGLQPGERGFTLHVEHYEGDKLVKQTVQKGLSPMAARERLALHMSGLWAGF